MSSSSTRRIASSRSSELTKRCAALALAATLAAPVLADPDPQGVAASSTGTSNSNEGLEEIVVTAQFRRENLQIVPIAITAVTSQTMDERNMTTLTDVANVAPNVTMFVNSAAFGKTNAAFIRGIGQGDFNLAGAPRRARRHLPRRCGLCDDIGFRFRSVRSAEYRHRARDPKALCRARTRSAAPSFCTSEATHRRWQRDMWKRRWAISAAAISRPPTTWR